MGKIRFFKKEKEFYSGSIDGLNTAILFLKNSKSISEAINKLESYKDKQQHTVKSLNTELNSFNEQYNKKFNS